MSDLPEDVIRIVYKTVDLDDLLAKLSNFIQGRKDFKVLNVGCGKKKLKGGINLDIVKLKGVDVLGNIVSLPFKENNFDVVIAWSVLEHLTVDEFHKSLKELKRVCKKKALIKINVPYFSSESAYSTIDHKLFFAYNTFWRYKIGDYDYTTPKLFSDVDVKLVWHTHKKLKLINSLIMKIINLHPLIAMFYQHFLAWIFPMRALNVVLRVDKDASS